MASMRNCGRSRAEAHPKEGVLRQVQRYAREHAPPTPTTDDLEPPPPAAGLRPLARARPVRILASANGGVVAPTQLPSYHSNGPTPAPAAEPVAAAVAPAGPQPVSVSGPVPIQGVLPPAAIYEAVSGDAAGGLGRFREGCGATGRALCAACIRALRA